MNVEDSENRKSKNKEEYKEFRKHFNKIQFHLSGTSRFSSNRISKDQVEKLNNLIGALICHGKDHLDYDYVEDDLIEYFIETFLYSIDSDYRSYLEVKPLYKCEGKTPKGPMLYVKTENEYKSDFEVNIVEKDKNDKCIKCACSNCQAAHDNYCPGENHFGKDTNCDHCIYESKVVKKGDKIELTKIDEITMNRKDCFKEKCDGKFEAVKSWCIECSSFDMITPLVDEWREERKKINFRRAIKAWREVYHYVDSFLLEDENDFKTNSEYPFRFWYFTRDIGKAIEYGLWGVIEYYDIYKPDDKEWYWYKRMRTQSPRRQEGDVMPHQHFNLYIWNIMWYINNFLATDSENENSEFEQLYGILKKIQAESDIISSWSQNGMHTAADRQVAMPCTVKYYEKIESICTEFMEFIKKIMNLKDEHDIMSFIGIGGSSISYEQLQI